MNARKVVVCLSCLGLVVIVAILLAASFWKLEDLEFVGVVAVAFSSLGFVLILALFPAWLLVRKLFRRGRFELATLFGLTAVVATELALIKAFSRDDEVIFVAVLSLPFAIGIVGIVWLFVREFVDVSSPSRKRTGSPFQIRADDKTFSGTAMDVVEKLDRDRIDRLATNGSGEPTPD